VNDNEQPSGLTLTGVGKILGGRTIVDDLDLWVGKGELVCLLGPSGCGKTTTLRMIAGFLTPDVGTITIDGADVTGVPPEKRPTAMVFQNYALWPHMTVFENVAYPLKLRRTPRNEITARVHEMLELVNLMHHEKSRPARISGGEQQRVALARALVQRPAVLLLDEPLSNLDAKLRVRVREDIREIQQRLGITTVIVTHDQDEALSISDRVAVMNAGRIEQYAAPDELYRTPTTLFTAEFVGSLNRLDDVVAAPGLLRCAGGAVTLRCAELVGPSGPGTTLCNRPVEVRIETDPRATEGASAVAARVLPRGHFTEVVLTLDTPGASDGLTLRSYVAGPAPSSGDRVRVTVGRALSYGANKEVAA
jgi:putative spermidine/putrescine transport system ATP-binding protein